MKLHKKLILAYALILLMAIAGCSLEDSRLSIHPEIYEYTPTMSSVPGIALTASFQRDLKNKNYKFHWVAEQGIFLTRHDDGKGRIEALGNDIRTNVHKVYWTVNPDRAIKEDSFKVYLSVEHIDTNEIMYETYIVILQQKEGYFSIKK